MKIPKNPFDNLEKSMKILFLVGIMIFYLSMWAFFTLLLPIFGNSLLFIALTFPLLILFFISWQLMGEKALIFIIISLVFFCWGKILWVEEQYCWSKGVDAEKEAKEPVCIPLTEEDKKFYGNMDCIYAGYKAHMDCHKNFSFDKAFADPQITIPDRPFYHPWIH